MSRRIQAGSVAVSSHDIRQISHRSRNHVANFSARWSRSLVMHNGFLTVMNLSPGKVVVVFNVHDDSSAQQIGRLM